MSRTRVLVGATVAVLLGGGAVVAATGGATNPTSDARTVAEQPQMPKSVPIAGAASDFSVSSSRSLASAAAGGVAAVGGAPGGAAAGGAAVAASSSGVTSPAAARVVKTAVLEVSVAERRIEGAANRIAGLASAAGGFVTASDRSGRGKDLRAHYTLRVPADRFDSARDGLAKLGDLRDETLGGRDVSGQLVDYEARLRSMRAEEEALRSILSKANTVGETLQVTQALGEVRGRIEQLDAERAQLADAADLSTIDVTIAGPAGVVSGTKPEPLLAGSVDRAAHAALAVVGGTIVVLGAVLPLGALVAAALLLSRGLARRRRRVVTAVAS